MAAAKRRLQGTGVEGVFKEQVWVIVIVMVMRMRVVNSRAFSFFLLHNHIINI
jgi:hypothetical protein